MDVIVTAAAPNIWNLADLLGRNMGTITGTSTGFQVYPASWGIEALDAVTSRPHPSLDEDLAEIERVTRGLAGAQVEARGAIDRRSRDHARMRRAGRIEILVSGAF